MSPRPALPAATATASAADCPDPPEWARLQRTLLAEAGEAIDPVLERYTRDDGSVLWPPADDYAGIDAVDDAYESVHNWPLLYALGGDRRLLAEAKREWEAITEQFASVPTGLGHPQILREYQQGHDWFHQSEGNLLFYHVCLADPGDEAFRERARRFAGFYLNEDPEVPDVYDEERDLIRCPMNGSSGPAYHNFSADVPPPMYGAHSETRIPWQYSAWKETYGLPFYDLEGIDEVTDLREEANARRMGEAIRDRCSRGDCPQNLGATTLLANAYLLTGDRTYADRVTGYVAAWAERAERNGGLLPDNVDGDGEIGGDLPGEGRWYGGWYGWTWPHGWHSLGRAVTGAAELAALLDRDRSHLDLPRSQLEELEARAVERDGETHLPYRYGGSGPYPRARGQTPDEDADAGGVGDVKETDDGAGWFDYEPAEPGTTVHLWYASGERRDRERAARLRTAEHSAATGLATDLKDFGGNEYPWLAYLDGEYPDYPAEILAHGLEHVRERVAAIETDDQDPATYDDYYLARRNPVTTEALVQLTWGAPQEVYNGGLPLATVRHFDPERGRPGLPPDVAALVTRVAETGATLELVNTGDAERTATVQAGCYAEHRFGTVGVADGDEGGGDGGPGSGVAVDGPAFDVALPPRSRVELTCDLERFVRDPTYAFPWDRSGD
jgi:hypothetical protein